MVAPMVLLMFGPLLMLLPWNYQRIDFTPGSLGTQGLPAEPWTPTGATSGELWWYTYNPAISAEVNDVPVVVALCPMGTTAIDPGMCHPPAGSTFASLTHADYSVSIPEGWHVVAEVNVSSICSGCHTSVRFSTPATALGLALTLAGIGVLVPCIVIWLRVRARTKSAWPA